MTVSAVALLPARQPRSALRRHGAAGGGARRLAGAMSAKARQRDGRARAPRVRGAGCRRRRDRPPPASGRCRACAASSRTGRLLSHPAGRRRAAHAGVGRSWPGCRPRSAAHTWPSPSGRAALSARSARGPHDRIMVVTYAPEVGGLSDRRFAGGRPTFLPRLLRGRALLPVHAGPARAASRCRMVLAGGGALLRRRCRACSSGRYLRQNYERRIEIDGGQQLRVLARPGLPQPPVRPGGLPCFAPRPNASGRADSVKMQSPRPCVESKPSGAWSR